MDKTKNFDDRKDFNNFGIASIEDCSTNPITGEGSTEFEISITFEIELLLIDLGF